MSSGKIVILYFRKVCIRITIPTPPPSVQEGLDISAHVSCWEIIVQRDAGLRAYKNIATNKIFCIIAKNVQVNNDKSSEMSDIATFA
ncbi:unnamed protein product [Cylicocyclus nassatus]|uniref:Uncharacterized protein n=1 Tax=Cylicocyclus nassatus TaxID=53992 RepID=A0AA36GTV3_CYLNA|nr:unnamed protein product [Cylicocyclus nassatus]